VSCVHTTSLGAYVLGALDPGDRQDTEQHLRGCALCRDELVRMAPLPGLLGLVSLSDLVTIEAEPWAVDLPAPLTPTPTVNRRWTRFAGTAAAVAAMVLGVIVAGRVVMDDPASPAQEATAPATSTWSTAPGSTTGRIDASAVLSDRAWGTDIDLAMADLPIGQRCRLVVRSVDGRAETAGWWTTGYDSTAEIPASTSIDLAAIDRLEVVRADGQVLAVLGPSGG
jgi:Putative zinc-finger